MITISPGASPVFLDRGEQIPNSEGLKSTRKELSWSVERMGEELGVSHRTIQNWECGRREMPKTAILLLRCLLSL